MDLDIGVASRRGAALARAGRLLAQGMAEALWPTRCAGCDEPGVLLCPRCTAALPAIEQRYACPLCGAPFGSLVCTECTDCVGRDGSSEPCGDPACTPCPADLDGVTCYGIHAWPLDRLIRAYKDAGELRLAGVVAGLCAAAAREAARCGRLDPGTADVLTFVPSTPAAFARRGGDHMEAVAREVARMLGLPFSDLLARRTPRDQRGLGREGRVANVRHTCVAVGPVGGRSVLLLDDVVTTGATMAEAARALRRGGAIRVWGLAAARAW